MRLLLVSPVFPQRSAGGFGLRTLGLLRELASAHEVHLLCLCSQQRECAPDPMDLEEIRSLVADLTLHEMDANGSGRLSDRLRMSWDGIPSRARPYCLEANARAFKEALAKEPALVLFESVFPAVLSSLVPGNCPVVLDEHNVEFLLLKRSGRPKGFHPLGLAGWRLRWSQLKRFEKRMLSEADLVLTTSEVDRAHLSRLTPERPIEVIPNGVLIGEAPPPREKEKARRLLITGLMDYPPNVDGAVWFAKQVFPALLEECPGVELVISGNRPTAAVQALGEHPSITVTGHVPDMNHEIDQAALVVVPLRQGSGTRLKILEAWSRRKAVVSTSLGSEGLSFCPGVDLVLANRRSDLVARIRELLENPQLRERIGQSGYETAARRYSWSNIGRILREHLENLTQSWS